MVLVRCKFCLQCLPALFSSLFPHLSLFLLLSHLHVCTHSFSLSVWLSMSLSLSFQRSSSSLSLLIYLPSLFLCFLFPCTSSVASFNTMAHFIRSLTISTSFLQLTPHFSLSETCHFSLSPSQPTLLNLPHFHYLLTSWLICYPVHNTSEAF